MLRRTFGQFSVKPLLRQGGRHQPGHGGLLSDVQTRPLSSVKALTFNAGSSTLKYGLFDVESCGTKAILVGSGLVDKMGVDGEGTVIHDDRVVLSGQTISDHGSAIELAVDILRGGTTPLIGDVGDVGCVGHRVVHGGTAFSEPTVITDEVCDEIGRWSALAPLHNPPALSAIQVARDAFPSCPHVAVFDTAFHATMPPDAYRYAIPKSLYDNDALRRYGFHGTSYRYVTDRVSQHLNRPRSDLNLIVCHLGSGASMCCIKGGVSVDTTMGLTPLEGLVMGTRSGDIDPGVLHYLSTNKHMSSGEIDALLNKKSGLLGLTGGMTADMRKIKENLATDDDCQLARDVYIRRIRKYLGSYMVQLEGKLDAIVFCGGVGEGDVELREAVCGGLVEFGVSIDSMKNSVPSQGGDIADVGGALSKTKVLVVPTDEEVSIALQSANVSGALPDDKEAKKAVKAIVAERAKSCASLYAFPVEDTYSADEEISLMNAFMKHAPRVGYFRPVAHRNSDESGGNHRIDLMKEHFFLDESPDEMYGITLDELNDLISHGKDDEVYERILDKFMAYKAKKDFVLVSCSKIPVDRVPWNAKICAALDLPLLLISDAGNEERIRIVSDEFRSTDVSVSGVLVGSVGQDDGAGQVGYEEARAAELAKLEDLGLKPVGLLPRDDELYLRTVAEVQKTLGAKLLFGGGGDCMNRIVRRVEICSRHALDYVHEVLIDEDCVVTHFDRHDVINAILLSQMSQTTKKASAIILTGYKGTLPETLTSMLSGMHVNVPILGTPENTYETAMKINDTPTFLLPGSVAKMEVSDRLFDAYFDQDGSFVSSIIGGDLEETDITPKLWQYSVFNRAREDLQRIVLPEGSDIRVVESAAQLVKRKLCHVVLVGDEEEIASHASTLGVDLSGCDIINPAKFHRIDEMADLLVDLRKHKGMVKERALEAVVDDVSTFGVMMLKMGLADGMVSGAVNSSANTIRPALQILKMAPGAKIVSSIFFMLLPDKVRVFGDCALNVDPSAEELSEIAVASTKTARAFGVRPRVAMLSYATGDSNTGAIVDKVIAATKRTREQLSSDDGGGMDGLDPRLVEGPIQFDAAVDPAVAAVKFKGKESLVAGDATVLVFPDLNTGNITYKGVQQASKTIAVGPVLQGLAKPVNDLSRGATVDDIVNTAVITSIQAQAMKEESQ